MNSSDIAFESHLGMFRCYIAIAKGRELTRDEKVQLMKSAHYCEAHFHNRWGGDAGNVPSRHKEDMASLFTFLGTLHDKTSTVIHGYEVQEIAILAQKSVQEHLDKIRG